MKLLPSNAKYTSPDVQNEVAEILSEMVKEMAATRVMDSKFTQSWWMVQQKKMVKRLLV